MLQFGATCAENLVYIAQGIPEDETYPALRNGESFEAGVIRK